MLFVTTLWVFTFWPLYNHLTLSEMNWSSVIFSGVIAVAAIYYAIWGRHTYRGPVTLVKRDA
jgi:choline transport protein